MLDSEQIQEIIPVITDYALAFSGRLMGAVLVLIAGWFVIKYINKLVKRGFERTEFDLALESFMQSLISISLKIILFIVVVSMLGVEMTSFVALLGAAGLAVGLALQGSLSNFAGGVLILFFKVFKVGDYIEGAGEEGTVQQIQIFNTILKTPDGKKIIVPNGELSNNSITNYSAYPMRRIDLVIGIDYSDDIKKAKDVLEDVVSNFENAHTEPAPQIVVGNLGDSAVELFCRVWVDTENYLASKFELTEIIKLRFDKEGLSFPFPQRDVHLYSEK